MRIQSAQLIALGYGKFVRSDEVIAVEPIVEGAAPAGDRSSGCGGCRRRWSPRERRPRSSTTW